MSKLGIALVGLLIAAAPVAAQKVRYRRDAQVNVEVKLTERVKPKGRATTATDAKPVMTAELALSIEGLKGTFQAEQEQILRKLIEDTPDHEVDEKANYYFILGELLAKQHRYWRLKAIEQSLAGNKQDSDSAAANARAFLVRAVGTYQDLTGNDAYRDYPKMDTALFYFAYTLQHGRYVKEARAAYDKLLKNYPRSKYVPEAHFAFADHYFEAGQLADAEARYRKVLAFPRSPVYWHAMYKLGWIHLNQQRPQEALERFFQVARAVRGDRKQEVLYRGARKDFVRAYAEVGKAERAYVAFQRVSRARAGRDDARALEMLATLADLYLEQGKSAHAIYAFQELMRIAPTSANACLWQYQIAQATLSLPRDRGDTTAAIVKEIENLVRLYTAVKTKLPRAEAQECHDNAAAMSGQLARAYHSEYAKTQNPDTLAHADKLYRAYLGAFPHARDHAETQYYQAELLWARATTEKRARLQTELWEQAANAFTAVVRAGKVSPRLVKEAAYAAVLGWKNALDVDPSLRVHAVTAEEIEKDYESVPQPKPIPAREGKLLAASRLYVERVRDADDDELVRIKFYEANTYRRYNHFARAIPLFEDILAKHRDHEAAELAAQLLLDIHNKRQDHAAMLALVDRLAADAKFLDGKSELADVLARLRIQHRRKQAEELEKRARAANDYRLFVACGNTYMDIYNADPEAKENDQVLYNAVVCYHDGKSVGAAIRAFDALQRFYPKSRLMPRAIARIGKAYGDVAFYEQAAEQLEAYAKSYAGEADAHAALSDAVVFRKGIGHDDKAIANTKLFVRMFAARKPQEAAAAHFSLTSIYEKQGNHDALVRHLREYLHRFGAKGGAARVVIAHAKMGLALWAKSCPRTTVDGACVEVSRERAIRVKLGRGAHPTQCGPASKIKLRVVRRSPALVADSIAALSRAVQAYDDGKLADAGARHYYAQAKLAQADRDFEAYLAHAFPHGLDFDARSPAILTRSVQRFDGWVAGKTRLGAAARAQYEAVLAVKDAASSIAAAARIAQISQHFSDALYTAEIPKNVRSGAFAEDKIEAFCDRMAEVARPLEERSLEGYRVCLEQSTKLGWFSEWSKLCERELGQIRPDEFPTATELRGPASVAAVIAVEGPIDRLE